MNVRVTCLVAWPLWLLVACADNTEVSGGAVDHEAEPQASSLEQAQEDAPQMTPRSSASIEHMHAHASQLDRLNAALAAGELEAAGTPAYWLSKHETLSGLPEDLLPYLIRMRTQANIIEGTHDLAAARAAASRLEASCEACHKASGH